MNKPLTHPRVLVVTPEVTVVPQGLGPTARRISARAGGLGDVCAALIQALHEEGVDVHLALPNYRNVFAINAQRMPGVDLQSRPRELPENRIHLAQDRSFYYHPKLFLATDAEAVRLALAFQREVINRIIPEVRPDLIHCFDWMTGLIPAMARRAGIPCIVTLYRLDSPALTLAAIEERGIDAAAFWQACFYLRMPDNYEETRAANPVDLLTTGVFAAHSVVAFSPTFLTVLIDDAGAPPPLRTELRNKRQAGMLSAIVPAPDPSFDPADDRALTRTYGPDTHAAGKLYNKLALQEALNLTMDSTVPVCFWPTRLDGSRPGCRLMIDTLAEILARHQAAGLQVVFVADGDCQAQLRALIERLHAGHRAAVCAFDARRYRLAFAGADFVLMPLRLDPCGLPCRIAQRYGALPIGYDGGAVHDCVEHLDMEGGRGNGFLFRHFDAAGFIWALDQALAFYARDRARRAATVRRIMTDRLAGDDRRCMVRQTLALYRRVLERPLTASRLSESSPMAA